jgi:AGZA family xanthine/uracil permease-like MFS transporter
MYVWIDCIDDDTDDHLLQLIPDSIQAAISVGIGMITALAGATEINLIVQGKYTILDMGPLTDEVVIAIACLILVAILMHYHIKGAFCTGLFVGTFLWWCVSKSWPTSILAAPHSQATGGEVSVDVVLLVFNLFVLYILALNGMGRSLSDLAGLTLPSGAIPRGGMLFIVCGLITMLSGYLSGPPILISPESAAGIKAGAKTGLSTVVCGLLFGISTFFSPLLAAIPGAGTAPLLIMVGVMMFANVKRIDWVDYKIATSAYCTLFFIPFTYSILRGVAFGYVIYIVIGLFTVDIRENYQYAVEKYSTWMQVTSTYAKFGDAEESRETTELDAEGTGTEDGPEQQEGSPARKRRSSFAVMHMDMDHLRMDNISRFLDTIALSKSEIERVDFM